MFVRGASAIESHIYEDGQPAESGLVLPLNPEEVAAPSAARMQAHTVLDLGELVTPRGTNPTRVPLEAFFPGPARDGDPWFKAPWRHPLEYVALFGRWMANGTRLRLLLTGTFVNGWLMYLESFTPRMAGAQGDVRCSLEFVQVRALRVLTDQEAAAEAVALASEQAIGARSEPAPPATWTVQEGQTLWEIARRVYGDGARWNDLWQANLATIGADPDVLAIGTELVIP